MRRQKPTYNKKKFFIILTVFFLAIFGPLLFKAFSYVPVAYEFAFKKESDLKKTENRINILLLGIGGGIHEGPNLTDTIIFASIDPERGKTTLVSIPRDLWVKEENGRINSIYAKGEDIRKGGGLVLTKAAIGKLVGQHIDYGFRIDFNGFVKAVDMIGGLDINVERSFDDYAYPVSGKEEELCGWKEEDVASLSAQIATNSAQDSEFFPCRYEHLHFDKGLTHMDGITALKYVRSRHAFGIEGSDFARSQRQQKVISSFKEKIFSLQTILNPVKLSSLIDVLQSSIDTDIKKEEYDDFIKLAQKMQNATIEAIPVDTGDGETGREGLLIEPEFRDDFGGAWVLIPARGNGNYSQIQKTVACAIQVGCVSPTPRLEK